MCSAKEPAKDNSALPYFGVIALCSFLLFDLCQGHNSDTIRNMETKLCK
jgi:hypothetical protein